MRKNFCGLWATYEYLDDLCAAITELKSNGFKSLSTHSPCPRHEIEHALGGAASRVPFITLFFALMGTGTAFLLTTWISLDWVLPVSSKPIVSVPPFTVIAFELTILCSAYGTMIGVVTLIIKDTLARSFPGSEAYKKYSRFTNDRFGLIVRCSENDRTQVRAIIEKYQAEEVNDES